MSGPTSPDNPHTSALARFVATVRFDDIPAEVRARLKLLILDSLGCAIYGVNLPWSRILIETLSEVDSDRSVGVWGTDQRLSVPHATLANGALVQGFELDDVHRQGVLHVGAVTLPALIAITELRPGSMTGRDFLVAALAGYEVGPRVGICMGQEHIGQGWHSGATTGVFSAAAGAARGLGLDTEKTVHALGIAGTQSAGLMAAQYGAMVKRMHAGRSSQSGLYGALLAEKGFTGIVNVFESEYGGFCTTFSRSQDRFNMAALSAGLGEIFETMRISLKFYSCVGSNHTTLDAIRTMQERHPFTADDVEKFIVHGSQVTMDHVGWKYRPEGLTSAQLNLPFCIATLMLEGDVFVDQFPEDSFTDRARIAYADRVEVRHDPEITAKGSNYRHMVRVETILKDGTHLEETVEAPRGSEECFASEQMVVEKFMKLARHGMGETQARELCDEVLALEDLEDAGSVARLLKVA
ncbi:MAG: MmgE/PrpD family protein [Alphaproteobacteria bacterium]|nr:MmgE/PrpD family protein [Alphaproteobacteria bacterium]